MTPTLQFILLVSMIILAAKTGGLVSTRLGQPAVLGELLVGLGLGPSLLDLLHQPTFADAGTIVLELGELGVIFLMFIAGLEVDLDEMLRSGRVAVLVGVAGVASPLILGSATALLFRYSLESSLFVGLILTATSVSISAQTLLELGLLGSKEGLALLGAAVIDDVLGILLLSVFLAFVRAPDGSNIGEIVWVLLRVVLFFGFSIGVGLLVVPRAVRWVDNLPISEGIVAFVVVVTLLYAWAAQALGDVATITGAFVAGALFARTSLRRPIFEGMHTLTYAFFVPIFLIGIGLRADARALGSDRLVFAIAIVVVAVAAKMIGSWIGARAGGFSNISALRVSAGMVSRGEVGLIIASIGLSEGLVDSSVYATMVVTVIATTLLTPFLLRRVFAKAPQTERLAQEGT